MKDRDQIRAFHADVTKVIDRYRSEFDLPLAGAIGTLQVICFELWKDADDELNGSEDEE